jgi:hypothetical protein
MHPEAFARYENAAYWLRARIQLVFDRVTLTSVTWRSPVLPGMNLGDVGGKADGSVRCSWTDWYTLLAVY